MKKRSEIIARGPEPSNRAIKARSNPAKSWFYSMSTLDRWNDIPGERERIRTIVRRMNRRFKRMSGQGFDNA